VVSRSLAEKFITSRVPKIEEGQMVSTVLEVVQNYIQAVRTNAPSLVALHPDVVGEFPTNTYRGANSFLQALEPFSRIVKNIDVARLIVEGEHCVALMNIDTLFGPIAFAEHIHVVDGLIVYVRGYYDPRPILNAQSATTTSAEGE
jgi:hypothetical protein